MAAKAAAKAAAEMAADRDGGDEAMSKNLVSVLPVTMTTHLQK
jgi:hypothetical protein